MAEKTKITPHEPTQLFINEDGSPMIFFMRPCKERVELRPIIEKEGGKVTVKACSDCIKLAEIDSAVGRDGLYLSTRYIRDCVDKRQLLDQEKYRVGFSSDRTTYTSTQGVTVQIPPYVPSGRSKFWESDDIAIIKYLAENDYHKDAMGMRVWREMEELKITEHSAPSMNNRYRRYILPNLDKYSYFLTVKKSWLTKLASTKQPREQLCEALFPKKKSTLSCKAIPQLQFEVLPARGAKQGSSVDSTAAPRDSSKNKSFTQSTKQKILSPEYDKESPDISSYSDILNTALPRKEQNGKKTFNGHSQKEGNSTAQMSVSEKDADKSGDILEDMDWRESNGDSLVTRTGQSHPKEKSLKKSSSNSMGEYEVLDKQAVEKDNDSHSSVPEVQLLDDLDFGTQTEYRTTVRQPTNSKSSSSSPLKQGRENKGASSQRNKDNPNSTISDAETLTPDFETYIADCTSPCQGGELSMIQPPNKDVRKRTRKASTSQFSTSSEDSFDNMLLEKCARHCDNAGPQSDNCRTRSDIRAASDKDSTDMSFVGDLTGQKKDDREVIIVKDKGNNIHNKSIDKGKGDGVGERTKVSGSNRKQTDKNGSVSRKKLAVSDCMTTCQSIAALYGLSLNIVYTCLFENSGDVQRTVNWLKFGEHSPDCPPWSDEEDKLLKSPEGLSNPYLIRKFGYDDVIDRIDFLEGCQQWNEEDDTLLMSPEGHSSPYLFSKFSYESVHVRKHFLRGLNQ